MNKLANYLNNKSVVNTSNFKPFLVKNIFEIRKVKKYSKIPRNVEGDVAFISSQSTNNGIASYCNYEPITNKAITVSTNGNNFDCFYHDYLFVTSLDVEVLFNKNLNKYNALFICSILNKESEKYNFGKKAKNGAVSNTIIYLPIDASGNPNWEYMEQYMKDREWNIFKKITKLNIKNMSKLKMKITKPFLISDLFYVSRGKRIVRNRDYKDFKDSVYKYPVITSTMLNNSVDGYYNRYNCNGNVICCGGEASGMFSTYQENKCWVMDRSRILEPKFKLTKNIALYLIPQLNKYMEYFSYEKSANPSDIEKLMITLPIDLFEKPDWKYIEEYIDKKEREILSKLFM